MLTVQAVLFKEDQATAAKATITTWQDRIKAQDQVKAVEDKVPVRA
jgi:hypothetical protein